MAGMMLAEPMIKFEPKNWDSYTKTAKKYLARSQFNGTPLTAEMITKAARTTYEQTGVHVPVELVLAQAQFESHMGTRGRNPATNPFNVGEYDAGTKMRFKDASEGVNAYFNLMAKDYMNGKDMPTLLKNFVNKDGNRYASDPHYEPKLAAQVAFIQKNFGVKA
jgi:flagellum-specific peptidoglycan hydrolase FlgJ